jgi:Surface-adhesin protein E
VPLKPARSPEASAPNCIEGRVPHHGPAGEISSEGGLFPYAGNPLYLFAVLAGAVHTTLSSLLADCAAQPAVSRRRRRRREWAGVLLIASAACAPRSEHSWVVLDESSDATMSVDTSRIGADSGAFRLWLRLDTPKGDSYPLDSARSVRVFRAELSVQLDCRGRRIRHLVDRLYDSTLTLMTEQPSDQQWASFRQEGLDSSGLAMCARLKGWGFSQ